MTERDIFTAALAKQDPAERAAFLDEACAGDTAFRQRVESLLLEHQQLGSFMDVQSQAVAKTVDMPQQVECPGAVIGPYKLLQQIGEGGMGVVYMAEQSAPVRRKVALKVIKPGMDTREVIARFESERQALALMDHPNIAHVFDGGTSDAGRPYFVMELVRGVPITDYCDQNNLPVHERLELFVTVCHAVQHAHQKGIIHRDIKPTNVLVTTHDGRPVPKVIDFGVAKAVGQQLTEKTLFTQFAQMVGTPLYMSPEQAELTGQDVDTRGDIYSLGVLLYELLTGTTPFERARLKQAALDEIRRMIREEDPPSPSSRLSSTAGETQTAVAAHRRIDPRGLSRLVRGELDWIVMKALEKDRNRRYETTSGLAGDIQRYLSNEPVLACPPSAVYRFRKFAQRNRTGLLMTSIVTIALMLAVGSLGWSVRDRSARTHEAIQEQMARQTKMTDQIDSIAADVNRFEADEKWPEALAAARRAEAAVASGEADEATHKRVRQWLKDLEFISRLDEIRMERATTIGGSFDYSGSAQQFSQAFRDYGIDIDQMSVEASIIGLKDLPELAVTLATALDEWAFVRRATGKDDSVNCERLVAIARGIDREPTRDCLRSQAGKKLTPLEQTELRRLTESIDVRAQHPSTLAHVARALNRENLQDVALPFLRNARTAWPEDFWLNFDLAIALANQKDWEGAIRFDTVAAVIRPSSAGALRNLGYSLRQMDQTAKIEEAETLFRKANELDPTSARGFRELGYVLNIQGQHDEAITAFRRSLQLEPDNVYGEWGLGQTIWKLGNRPNATPESLRRTIELCQDLIKECPQSDSMHQYLGWFQFLTGNWEASIESLEKSCRLKDGGTGDCGQWIVMSLAHWKLANEQWLSEPEQVRHKAEARRLYDQAADEIGRLGTGDTRTQAIRAFRAEAAELMGLKPDIKSLEILVAAQPGAWEPHVNLAQAYANEGLSEKALVEFTRATEAEPDAWEPWSRRAFAHFQQQRWDEAASDFSKAITLAPQVHTNWWHLGHSYLNLAQWNNAAANFGKVVEQWPQGGEGWYLRGVALAKLNRPEEAMADLREAIRKGFAGVKLMKIDARLESLRTREDFSKLLREFELKEKSEGK